MAIVLVTCVSLRGYEEWLYLELGEALADDEGPEVVEDAAGDQGEPAEVEVVIWVDEGARGAEFLTVKSPPTAVDTPLRAGTPVAVVSCVHGFLQRTHLFTLNESVVTFRFFSCFRHETVLIFRANSGVAPGD